jgi:lipoprotein LprG
MARTWWIGILTGVVVLMTGCSSDPETDAADEPDPDLILTESAAAMAAVESASFTIEQTGGSLFIDDNDQLAFQSADGRFAAPASSEALVTVDALGFTTQVGAVAIDGDLWFTNPLSGEWIEAPEDFSFDPAAVFDPDEGFPALLTEASGAAELIDDSAEASDNEDEQEIGDRLHLRTVVSASRVSTLTGGLVDEASEVDLWIDPDTSRVLEVAFDIELDDAVSSWRMTLGDYDAEVTITPPELSPEG